MNHNKWDVVIVGGGLSGWISAAYAARGGKRVLLVEKAETHGGRAATMTREGVALNLGAHAVYLDGELPAVLKELGITLEGGNPGSSGHGLLNGEVHTLPGSAMSLFSSRLLSWRGKIELSRILLALKKLDESRLPTGSLTEWAESSIREPQVRHLFYALCRTATYAHQPDIQLAGPVLRQLKHVLNGGVLYVDGGWRTIIDRLRQTATATGLVDAVSGKVVEQVSVIARLAEGSTGPRESGSFEIRLTDGEAVLADAVIMAVPPSECCRIVSGAEDTSLDVWRKQARPVTSACLDLVMRRLTRPNVQFVIGIDSPFLFTNQSRAANLGSNGLLAVSVLKYHGSAAPDAARDRADMERILDILQPGWRDEVAARQYLPHMTVVYDHAHSGRTTLPGPAVPEIPGLYVAGDWAGHRELLADAAAASAKRAAEALLLGTTQELLRGALNGNRAAV
jgi:phytoene dehydrogenase-like protein